MKNTKRFITGMVTLAMVSAMAPMNVFATENTIPLNANTSSGSTDVKYSVDPSYTVVIPASVTLSDTSTTNATISVDETAKPFKLAKGQKLSVKIANEDTNDFKVTNADDSLDYTVTADSETLAKGSTAAEFSNDDKTDKTLTFSKMDASEAKYAGDYTGTLTFDIAVESAAAPALAGIKENGTVLKLNYNSDAGNTLIEITNNNGTFSCTRRRSETYSTNFSTNDVNISLDGDILSISHPNANTGGTFTFNLANNQYTASREVTAVTINDVNVIDKLTKVTSN